MGVLIREKMPRREARRRYVLRTDRPFDRDGYLANRAMAGSGV